MTCKVATQYNFMVGSPGSRSSDLKKINVKINVTIIKEREVVQF